MKLAYKVFCRAGSEYWSAMYGNEYDKQKFPCLRYHKYSREGVNKPEVGKFFVFSNVEAARKFINENDHLKGVEIWKVKVDKLESPPDCIIATYHDSLLNHVLKNFWKFNGDIPEADTDADTWPACTYCCQELIMVEKV